MGWGADGGWLHLCLIWLHYFSVEEYSSASAQVRRVLGLSCSLSSKKIIWHLLLDSAHAAQNCKQTLNRTHTHSPERHCAGSLGLFQLQVSQSLGWERPATPSTKQSAPAGQSSNSQYFRCLGKRVFPEDRSGGLAGLGPSESKLKRSLPVRRICSSSFLCRFMSERTLSRRASRFWLRAEVPKKAGNVTALRQ